MKKKNSIPWKTIKGPWNSSLLKKIKKKKNQGRWNYEVAWKKIEGSGTKWWQCSIKFSMKTKNHVLFLLKNQRQFLAKPIKQKRPAHFFFGHTACRILVPQPEIQPVTLTVKRRVLITGQPGNSQYRCTFKRMNFTKATAYRRYEIIKVLGQIISVTCT